MKRVEKPGAEVAEQLQTGRQDFPEVGNLQSLTDRMAMGSPEVWASRDTKQAGIVLTGGEKAESDGDGRARADA